MIFHDEEDTRAFGHTVATAVEVGDVITLTGPLGVGKTALARGILHGLGHVGEVPSPSFAIVQPYDDTRVPTWHVDLFRIEDVDEIPELGLDAADEGLLIVEWPERAGGGAFAQALHLTMKFEPGGARSLTARVPPSWEGRWPPR
jgi:tRNA threonylcarbamoyladenosine biosynthesis protein TsaE